MNSKLENARTFKDERFYLLAMRIVFTLAPDIMTDEERERVVGGIEKRLLASAGAGHPWRSIGDALAELVGDQLSHVSRSERQDIERWLGQLARKTGV